MDSVSRGVKWTGPRRYGKIANSRNVAGICRKSYEIGKKLLQISNEKYYMPILVVTFSMASIP